MRRILLLMLLLVVPPVATAILSSYARVPNRFAVVEQGRLYRGGYPSAEQVKRLKDEYAVRTIVNLTQVRGKNNLPVSDQAAAELDEARKLGLSVVPCPMPGDGRATFDVLDQAADALAKSSNQPIYFHCSAGKMRSGAALAAYRMKHCGWSYDAAMTEASRFDLDINDENDGLLRQHLRKYATYLRDKHGIRTAIAADSR